MATSGQLSVNKYNTQMSSLSDKLVIEMSSWRAFGNVLQSQDINIYFQIC